MSDGQDHQRRYSPGERIILGLELYNDNGIFYVAGRFVHADYPTVHITLPGYGGGKQHTTVYIQNVIVTNTLPGQYICEYIQAEDGRGNFSVLHPNITFYVEQQSALVDDQGPQLKGGWSFLPRRAIEFVEVPMIECQIFVRGRRTAQHDDAVLHHLYLQVRVGEKVFDVVLEALIFLREGVRDLHRYRGECSLVSGGSRRN